MEPSGAYPGRVTPPSTEDRCVTLPEGLACASSPGRAEGPWILLPEEVFSGDRMWGSAK